MTIPKVSVVRAVLRGTTSENFSFEGSPHRLITAASVPFILLTDTRS